MNPAPSLTQPSPDKPALIQGERIVTWAQLLAARDELAGGLHSLGLRRGDHVVIHQLNSIELYVSFMAASALGAVAIPMNHRLKAAEVEYIVAHCEAKAVLLDAAHLSIAAEIRERTPAVRHWILLGAQTDAPEVARCPAWALSHSEILRRGRSEPLPAVQNAGAAMLYTGGTSGRPKGAVRSAQSPAKLHAIAAAIGIASADHLHLVAGPLYHAGPLAFAGITMMCGGTLVLMPKFDAEEAWRLLTRWGCTSTFMAPTLLKRLLDVPVDKRPAVPCSLKALIVSGAPCPQHLKEQALTTFGPVFFEFYGATETALCTLLRPEDVLTHPGSCGRIAPGVRLKVIDANGAEPAPEEPGELFVHCDSGTFDGYYKDEAGTAESVRGDWVSVGDIASIDADGFVYIRDRKRDMIISGGANIYSVEVEEVLHAHPHVADVAVFGIPDAEWGESVHAAVELKPDMQADAADIISFARARIADYKRPRSVSFHDALPRDRAGKIRKHLLRDPYWARQS